MKIKDHMVDHVSDVMPMMTSDTTGKIQLLAPDKSPKDSQNGPHVTFHNARARKTTIITPTVWPAGITNSKLTWPARMKDPDRKSPCKTTKKTLAYIFYTHFYIINILII